MMPEFELLAAVPVMNVSDLAKAVPFYRDRLGFTVAFEFGPYAGVRLGPIEIHLNGDPDDFAARPLCCRFHVRGVEALHAAYNTEGVVKPDEDLRTTPYGMREFSILDPDGNRISFAESSE